MRQVLSQIDPIDAVALISVVVLTIGVAMVSVPASFVVAGALGLLYAVAVSRSEPTGGPEVKP